ncbi:hypothetical protein GWK08_06295 [Leptobacterium flavescens]|uniref:Uncharacterized protein n=1 Tax=Leptobacterium flavescens TaxID=472055 RepID=A0A6P0UI72_9FLAO|nr:hypothetical protein [Leptobacterium flavescens]NER13041.1 hypothetical protein [Leptobacterium flavescens]
MSKYQFYLRKVENGFIINTQQGIIVYEDFERVKEYMINKVEAPVQMGEEIKINITIET